MNIRKRPPITAAEIGKLVGISLAAVILLGVMIAANIRLAGLLGGGGFLSVWSAIRGFLFQGIEPYSPEAMGVVQQLIYGRPVSVGENPYGLTVPFFLVPLFFPFAFISSPTIAQGIWMSLGQAALIGGILLTVRLIDWQPPRLFVLFFSVLVVFGAYSTSAILDGSPGILLALLYPGILLAYKSGRDELVGGLLVLSLVSVEAGSIFLVLLVLRIINEKRWGIFAGFGMTLIILLVVSYLIYPGWALDFLRAIVDPIRSSYGLTTSLVMLHLWPAHGVRIAQFLAVLLLGMLVFEWASGRTSNFRRFVWICCLGLAIAPLLGFRAELYSFVLLYPCLLLICFSSIERNRMGVFLAAGLMAFAFLVPWFHFYRWLMLYDQRAYDFLFLLYPLISMVGLYWTRWWFLRPHRTWLDELRSKQK